MVVSGALLCLTLAVYHESRGEPVIGQKAIAEIVINRVENPYWPNSVCEVVTQKKQFSFYWDNLPLEMQEPKAEEKARKIAQEYLLGNPKKVFNKPIKCFVEKSLKNSWTEEYETVKVIGGHKFIDC